MNSILPAIYRNKWPLGKFRYYNDVLLSRVDKLLKSNKLLKYYLPVILFPTYSTYVITPKDTFKKLRCKDVAGD